MCHHSVPTPSSDCKFFVGWREVWPLNDLASHLPWLFPSPVLVLPGDAAGKGRTIFHQPSGYSHTDPLISLVLHQALIQDSCSCLLGLSFIFPHLQHFSSRKSLGAKREAPDRSWAPPVQGTPLSGHSFGPSAINQPQQSSRGAVWWKAAGTAVPLLGSPSTAGKNKEPRQAFRHITPELSPAFGPVCWFNNRSAFPTDHISCVALNPPG